MMMNTQVYLSPIQLSIISIPRSKVWLFNAAILQLLSEEAQQTPRSLLDITKGGSRDTPEIEISDLDSELSESEDDSLVAGANAPNPSSPSMTRQTSKTDNSSKLRSPTPPSECGSDYSEEADRGLCSSDEDLDCHFFHFAFTPTECTLIFPQKHIDRLFRQPLEVCKSLGYDDVMLLEKDYLNLQVDSEGEFNNSARIIELTKPLSQHNISLFFLSNHFTDIVLIPYDLKQEVMEILAENNFEFSDISNSYISIDKSPKSTSTLGDTNEINTLQLLGEANIRPKIHTKTKLLLTGARPGEVKQSILKASHCIAANIIPPYFSITRSSFTEISLILPSSLTQRSKLGFESRNIIGSTLDAVVPITVDLSQLPLSTTGIVAGLAGSLFESMKSNNENNAEFFLMNYLSMARSAVVLIPQEQIYAVSEMIKKMEFKDQ